MACRVINYAEAIWLVEICFLWLSSQDKLTSCWFNARWVHEGQFWLASWLQICQLFCASDLSKWVLCVSCVHNLALGMPFWNTLIFPIMWPCFSLLWVGKAPFATMHVLRTPSGKSMRAVGTRGLRILTSSPVVEQDKETAHMISLKYLIRLGVNHWVMNRGSYFGD